jgi:hypothetical protein
VDASNLLLKEFSLSLDIKLKIDGSSFLLSVVYGPSDDTDKLCFLD